MATDRRLELVYEAAKVEELAAELATYKGLLIKLADEDAAAVFLSMVETNKLSAPIFALALDLLATVEHLTPAMAINSAVKKSAQPGQSAQMDLFDEGFYRPLAGLVREALAEETASAQSVQPAPKKKDSRGRKSIRSAAVNEYLARGAADIVKAASNAANRPSRTINERVRSGATIVESGGRRLEKDCFRTDTPLRDVIPYAKAVVLLEDDVYTLVYATVFQPDETDDANTGTGEQDFANLDDAVAAFNLIPERSGVAPLISRSVRSYLPLAKAMLGKPSLGEMDLKLIPKNIGFALACYYEKLDSTVKQSQKGNEELLRKLDLVRRLLSNMAWPTTDDITRDARSMEALAGQWIPSLVINQKNKTSFLTPTQFYGRVSILSDTFDVMHKYFAAHFPKAIFNLSEAIKAVADTFFSTNEGLFNEEDNFTPLPLSDVQTILDLSYEISPVAYHQNLLKLSTVLRLKEFYKLTRNHLRADNLLEYNDVVEGAHEPLITKTTKSRPGGYPNPTTSILTRVIMKYLPFRMDQVPPSKRPLIENFWKSGGTIRKELTEEGGHERSLRTTGATLLRFGLKTKVCDPIDPKIIMERMAHVNENMISTVYAKNLPKDHKGRAPDVYFDMRKLILERPDGSLVDVSSKGYLLDIWLLRDLLRRYKGSQHEAGIKRAILAEIDGEEETDQEPEVF